MTVLFANNATTTLSGNIDDKATQISVASAANFPRPTKTGDYFCATIYDLATVSIYEIVHVASISGTTLQLASDGPAGNGRGQEGTSAQPWGAGNTISALVTAGSLNNFIQSGTGINTGVLYEGDDQGGDIAGHLNVPTLSPTPGGTAPVKGMTVIVTVNAANNGTRPTMANIMGSGYAAIVDVNGTPLDYPVETATRLMLTYEGGGGRWQALNVFDNNTASIHTGQDTANPSTQPNQVIAANLQPPIDSYAIGQQFNIKIANTPTGQFTASFGGLPAYSCYLPNGALAGAGDIVANAPAIFVYNGNAFNVFGASMTPSQDAPRDGHTYGRNNGAWQQAIPPGVSMDYWGTSVPSGWLREDGTLYNVATYPNLFAVIGNTYGGSGSLTPTPSGNFAVPNSQNLFSVAAGPGSGVGNSGGSSSITLDINHIPSHSHGLSQHSYSTAHSATSTSSQLSHTHSAQSGFVGLDTTTSSIGFQAASNAPPDVALNLDSQTPAIATTTTVTGDGAINTDAAGGAQSFGILPPFIARLRIIKT
jgi:microcystin-dependent protein